MHDCHWHISCATFSFNCIITVGHPERSVRSHAQRVPTSDNSWTLPARIWAVNADSEALARISQRLLVTDNCMGGRWRLRRWPTKPERAVESHRIHGVTIMQPPVQLYLRVRYSCTVRYAQGTCRRTPDHARSPAIVPRVSRAAPGTELARELSVRVHAGCRRSGRTTRCWCSWKLPHVCRRDGVISGCAGGG